MYYWYKFLTYLFYPLTPIYLFIRKLRKKEHPIRYKEKLSEINLPRGEGFLLWCHAASVGEAMSILPLIENFEQEEKIKKILITTITLSSAQVLQKKFKQNTKIVHQFLPLDIPKFVNQFLAHWTPNLAIFIDSEIWPNLIFHIKKKNINIENKILENNNKIRIFYTKYKAQNIEEFKNNKVIAFAGIGNPDNFFDLLKDNNINILENISFPDHYNYSNKELENLINKTKENNATLLTTEKDFFRINETYKKNIKHLKIIVEIENKNQFVEEIKKII